MFRFPYMRTPNRNNQQYRPPTPPQEENPFLNNASFSPQLSLLLSMVFKDGFCRNTALDLMKNIYPYVEPGDKNMIDKLFGIQEFAQGYRPNINQSVYPPRALSRQERYLSLLQILRQYAAQDTVSIFNNLERSMMMQNEFSRIMNRMENFRNMKSNNPGDMFGMLESFMPPNERQNIRSMNNMMNMFQNMQNMQNMNNFKPEDMMRMFSMMNMNQPNAGR